MADQTTTLIQGVVERRQVRFFAASCFMPVSVPDRGKLVDKLLSQSYGAERALGHSSRFVVNSFHSYHRVRRLTWQSAHLVSRRRVSASRPKPTCTVSSVTSALAGRADLGQGSGRRRLMGPRGDIPVEA
jgi:hypothetical protein